MIDIMSALESVRLPLSPVPTQTNAHAKPPLSPIRSELSYSSNEAIEVFMPKSPTSMMDVRLMYLMDYKMQNMQLKALRAVPTAISFTPIHCANDEETRGGDTCSSYTQDDTSVTSVETEEEEDDLVGSTYTEDDISVEMEEEDDLLGLDLLLDDDEEEEYNLDEMEAETR
jgi:hypothetical protein